MGRSFAIIIIAPLVLAFGYAVAVYASAGTSLGLWMPIALARAKNIVPALILLTPIALMAAMIQSGRGGEDRSIPDICRDFVRTRIAPGCGLPFAMPLLSAVVTGTAYMIYKQQVLPRTGFGADALLADMDRALLGSDAWRLTHRLFPTPTATWIIDLAYHPYFFPMTFGIALCTLLPPTSLARHRYVIGYVLLLIGPATIGSWLVAGVGPCFDMALHHTPRFAPLMDELARQQGLLGAHGHTLTSLDNQGTLATLFAARDLADGAGISAMPSLHNSLSTLFICFVVALRPKLAWVMMPYGVLILIGSVHLGWHYLVDSLAGIVLAGGVWLATGPIVRLLGSIAEVVRAPMKPALAY